MPTVEAAAVRPMRYWEGIPVPFIAAWSGERIPPQPLALRVGRGGVGLGFQDEDSHVDRQLGALWMRMPATRSGRPQFEMVHALRQRQAMTRLLCQMCGGPTIGTRRDERTLFLLGSADGEPIADGEQTTSPPLHAACALLAVDHCPFLRKGWAAALVSHTPSWGVAGKLYDPDTLEAVPAPGRSGVHRVSFLDAERMRWILASRLVVTLEGVERVTDLEELALAPAP
ncbi:hypothetical protein [Streptomyces sp. NBC_00557]|uniref:hypothetical protein n=1 Tax=Streptomyces sp. NBC_00557 TaxID=2975776 RepID=UPI002E81F0F2|nr:hypothetical protein [Streptomyces sp. NBC_00557]WUC36426.1 hypothetical protein OG956_20455 [Streptomyces sp. NBC_00557]